MAVSRIPVELSARIELMRITCIVCVVCVHIPSPFDVGQQFSSGPIEFLYNFLTFALFRAGTPTLSIISGYLLFRSFSLSDYTAILRKKAQTVLVPAILWGTGMTVLLFLAQKSGLIERRIFDLVGGGPFVYIDAVFGISHLPFNGPTYFLYDLFACIVLSPAIYFLLRYLPWTGACILIILWLSGICSALWIRGDIIVGFYVGGLLALHNFDLAVSKRRAVVLIGVFFVCCALLAWHITSVPQPEIDDRVGLEVNLLRFLGPVAMWSYATLVTRTTLAKRLTKYGSIALFVFCSHEPIVRLLGREYFSILGTDGPIYYPIFYVCAVITVILFALAAKVLLQRFSPQTLAFLSGGRLGRGERPFRRRSGGEAFAGSHSGAPNA